MAEVNSMREWSARATALRDAMLRASREDLLPPVDALARLLGTFDDSQGARAAELVGRTLGEIRKCVADAARAFDESLLDELLRRSAPPPARDSMNTTMPPSEADRNGLWASSVLACFASVEDAELGALTSVISPKERAKPKDDLGTLREPLGNAKPKEGAPSAGRVLMKGELHPGLLADLIQLFAQNAETGCLIIEGSGLSASVFFKDGLIIDAICGDATGEKAFFQSMLVREGRFSYQRGVQTDQVRIYRTAQHLIMDTLRQMDESP